MAHTLTSAVSGWENVRQGILKNKHVRERLVKAPNEALVPDADVLKKSSGPRTVAELLRRQRMRMRDKVPQPRKKSSAQAVVL